jgi:cbb3-type cytochrome oxidase subunit 3
MRERWLQILTLVILLLFVAVFVWGLNQDYLE